MKISTKTTIAALLLSGSVLGAPSNVCTIMPGNVTCSEGTVSSLNGNGLVTTKGTIVSGATSINGVLKAENSRFGTLDVNGSVKLNQCTVNDHAQIKGSLIASATTFENIVDIYSNETRLINVKINKDLHLGHTEVKKQRVYLDNASTILGNIIFDDGQGEVILQGQSKIEGKVIGGNIIIR